MNNDNQGRSDEKMKRNEQVAVWGIWGFIITFIITMTLKAFNII